MPDIRSTTELDAANDSIQIKTNRRMGTASAQTGPANPVGAVFVMEASWNGGDAYVAVQMIDPSNLDEVANLTGVSKAGIGDVTGADFVRMRRTDATGGEGDCSLTFSPMSV